MYKCVKKTKIACNPRPMFPVDCFLENIVRKFKLY